MQSTVARAYLVCIRRRSSPNGTQKLPLRFWYEVVRRKDAKYDRFCELCADGSERGQCRPRHSRPT